MSTQPQKIDGFIKRCRLTFITKVFLTSQPAPSLRSKKTLEPFKDGARACSWTVQEQARDVVTVGFFARMGGNYVCANYQSLGSTAYVHTRNHQLPQWKFVYSCFVRKWSSTIDLRTDFSIFKKLAEHFMGEIQQTIFFLPSQICYGN